MKTLEGYARRSRIAAITATVLVALIILVVNVHEGNVLRGVLWAMSVSGLTLSGFFAGKATERADRWNS